MSCMGILNPLTLLLFGAYVVVVVPYNWVVSLVSPSNNPPVAPVTAITEKENP